MDSYKAAKVNLAMVADPQGYKRKMSELSDRLRQRRREMQPINEGRAALGLEPLPITLNKFEARLISDLDLWSEIQESKDIDQLNIGNLQSTIEQENRNVQNNAAEVTNIFKELAKLSSNRPIMVDEFGYIVKTPQYEHWKQLVKDEAKKIYEGMFNTAHTGDARMTAGWQFLLKELGKISKPLADEIDTKIKKWVGDLEIARQTNGEEVERDPYMAVRKDFEKAREAEELRAIINSQEWGKPDKQILEDGSESLSDTHIMSIGRSENCIESAIREHEGAQDETK